MAEGKEELLLATPGAAAAPRTRLENKWLKANPLIPKGQKRRCVYGVLQNLSTPKRSLSLSCSRAQRCGKRPLASQRARAAAAKSAADPKRGEAGPASGHALRSHPTSALRAWAPAGIGLLCPAGGSLQPLRQLQAQGFSQAGLHSQNGAIWQFGSKPDTARPLFRGHIRGRVLAYGRKALSRRGDVVRRRVDEARGEVLHRP